MKRILSIDFDYFINTDIETRNTLFPDGIEKSEALCSGEWIITYNYHPELLEITIIDDSFKMYDFLENHEKGEVFIYNSHREIKKILDLLKDEPLEVVNIDFHHDNYISSGDTLDCANWVRHLMTNKPDTKFTWIRREDSELESLEGAFPYQHTTEFKLEGEFDYIFLCFSPEWTPPHLMPYYRSLICAIQHLIKAR